MNTALKITEDSQYSRQSRSLEGREELPLQGRVVDPPPELYIYIINRSTRGSRNFLLIFKISFVHRNYANNAQTVIKKNTLDTYRITADHQQFPHQFRHGFRAEDIPISLIPSNS